MTVDRFSGFGFAPRTFRWGREGGAALLVSLVILLVLTVLALSSMQGTTLQERMVASQRDSQAALEGAEHALMEAEKLLSQGTVPSFTNSGGLFNLTGEAPIGADVMDPATWKPDADKSTASSMPKLGGTAYLAEAPRYFIQILPADAIASNSEMPLNTGDGYMPPGEISATAYRVVARSTGISGQSSRVVEAYVFR